VTHLYTLLTGGRVVRGGGLPDATALAWAADTILVVGSDDQVASASRGDSMRIDLGGAVVMAESVLEAGAPADFDVLPPGGDGMPIAQVRAGRLIGDRPPGWHDHAADHDHDVEHDDPVGSAPEPA
jgi:hypothetical protein